MLLTSQDIKILLFIIFVVILIFIFKMFKKRKYEIIKDIPGGKLGKIIKALEDEGFKYIKTINNLNYNIIADNKEYEASVSKRTAIMKKGFKKYVIKIKNPKSSGKSINSKLIRYPFVEYNYLGYSNIIYYDYEKNKYRVINIPSLNTNMYALIIFLVFAVIVLSYVIMRSQ